jgi:flagellin
LDADFAVESTALSRGQIIEQAGISVLGQANQSAQQVIALLQNG